jgi:hypothetical protein
MSFPSSFTVRDSFGAALTEFSLRFADQNKAIRTDVSTDRFQPRELIRSVRTSNNKGTVVDHQVLSVQDIRLGSDNLPYVATVTLSVSVPRVPVFSNARVSENITIVTAPIGGGDDAGSEFSGLLVNPDRFARFMRGES